MQRLILIWSVLALAFGAPLFAQAGQGALETPAVLQPGDSVRITVWEEPELSGVFEVNTGGRLSHPLYGDFPVAGVPVDEFNTRLGEYLVRYRANPQFTVEPRFTVVVSGEVLTGGVFTLGPGVTLARAMTMAAPSARARLDRVKLIRDRETYIADFNDPEADWIRTTVRSGDHIIVVPRMNVLRDVIGPATGIIGSISSMISFVFFLTGR